MQEADDHDGPSLDSTVSILHDRMEGFAISYAQVSASQVSNVSRFLRFLFQYANSCDNTKRLASQVCQHCGASWSGAVT
jgi:hypothetical protein